MNQIHIRVSLSLTALLIFAGASHGTELARLGKENWKDFAPTGKEVDCIYGDIVLRNEQLVAVIAQPRADRNANMTVRNVGGMLIDLTRRRPQNDQLSAYYPGEAKYPFHSADRMRVTIDGNEVDSDQLTQHAGDTVSIAFTSEAAAGKPTATLRYTLKKNQPWLLVDLELANPHDQPVTEELADSIRADRTFEFGNDPATYLFWAYDEWFRQAYGVIVDGRTIEPTGDRGAPLRLKAGDESKETIAPGESITIQRKVFPARDLLHLKSIARRAAGEQQSPIAISVSDPAGAVFNAKVTIKQGDAIVGSGRTNQAGKLPFALPNGTYAAHVEALGRETLDLTLDVVDGTNEFAIESPTGCGYVLADIADESGERVPCKVAFHGKDGTASPYFGPDSAAVGVMNVHYSHNGQFRQEIGPGRYEVIISRGPEYDAVFTEIEVKRGEETPLVAKLKRTVDTAGWVSSDFHSHSSPSGDNTGSQRGRVLNLLCEHIEFGPCTEHNRIDTYAPHLKALQAERWMATCTGMELTGSPLPVNHQNAFPLIRKPRTQDGGAPTPDVNPVVQIERLAMWDGNSDKLVQGNHPDIVQIIGDKDLDGKPDGGFEKMFGFMDVIEVHPPQTILTPPGTDEFKSLRRNPIFHWMQMLNLGYRIAGVVNTDAHYNYHETGWLRNYLKSPTDDPAEIDTMQIVHAAERGNSVLSNGPFMRVELSSANRDAPAIPGDEVSIPDGRATLSIHVQCSNWLNVNRVQVFLNGKMDERLNFTRRTTPDPFGDGVVKFESTLPLELKSDTHIIVAAAGEGLTLGRVMGPTWGKEMPIAVSNPIFVDVDGDGFQPNGDLLGVELPLRP